MAKTWLFKTEPSTYSFADLVCDGKTVWDGVKNPQALRNLAGVAPGDAVLIYHTGNEKAVVGLARATSRAYPDPSRKNAKLLVVDLEAGKPLPAPVTLATIKADPSFHSFDLVRLPRLSVMPVEATWRRRIETLARETPR